MNFKRKHYRSGMMKKCSICGSQRRLGKAGRGGQMHKPRPAARAQISEHLA